MEAGSAQGVAEPGCGDCANLSRHGLGKALALDDGRHIGRRAWGKITCKEFHDMFLPVCVPGFLNKGLPG